MKNFKNLQIWTEAMDIAIEIYKTTELFPKTEIYGITNQMRRCSVSISSNIAEGESRKSIKERLRFLEFSLG